MTSASEHCSERAPDSFTHLASAALALKQCSHSIINFVSLTQHDSVNALCKYAHTNTNLKYTDLNFSHMEGDFIRNQN